jgi:AcrR family transcriptional regulator
MKKGEHTKIAILQAGLEMASELGLEDVTIGNLAKVINMSKSGLFAHFQSKENLQLHILNYAALNFSQKVIAPALKKKAGIPRIRALVENWISWSGNLTGGCIFVSASAEFSDRPGEVRKLLLKQQKDWIDSLKKIAKSAISVGDFRKDIDCDQFAFDIYSLLLGFHFYYQLLKDVETKKHQEAALDQLLNKYC